MKTRYFAFVTVSACVFIVSMTLAAQDRYHLTSPNGIAFSEFKGYEAWQVIAPSLPDDGIKVILGNPLMIKAYDDGFPSHRQTVPDGAMMAKIAWSTQSNPLLPGAAMVAGSLKKVQFMVKDTKRFPDTDGATPISPTTSRPAHSGPSVTARRSRRRPVTSVTRV
jgi:hypothetical protein